MNMKASKTITFQRVFPEDANQVLNVEKLFNGKKKIKLRHAEGDYTLQITSNNKLLLTK